MQVLFKNLSTFPLYLLHHTLLSSPKDLYFDQPLRANFTNSTLFGNTIASHLANVQQHPLQLTHPKLKKTTQKHKSHKHHRISITLFPCLHHHRVSTPPTESRRNTFSLKP
jgi:hypothetical protein